MQEGQQIIYMFRTWMFLYDIFIKIYTKFINVKLDKSQNALYLLSDGGRPKVTRLVFFPIWENLRIQMRLV